MKDLPDKSIGRCSGNSCPCPPPSLSELDDAARFNQFRPRVPASFEIAFLIKQDEIPEERGIPVSWRPYAPPPSQVRRPLISIAVCPHEVNRQGFLDAFFRSEAIDPDQKL